MSGSENRASWRILPLKHSLAWSLIGTVAILTGWVGAQSSGPAKPRVEHRAFDSRETSRIFFDDVFSVLVGSRPPQLDTPITRSAPEAVAESGVPSVPRASPLSIAPQGTSELASEGWDRLISAVTIENEIKAIKQLVDRDVTNPGEFRGRGYRECRRHFSIAAMLFGVITEYEGEVRWKNTASAARDVFARAAANAKVGSVQVYNEARMRKEDLDEILNGGTIPGLRDTPADVTWGSLLDRGPLMMRLETAFEERIQPQTSSVQEASNHHESLIHEAELMAAMATVLVGEGMIDGDDSTYAEYAEEMRQGARELIGGIREDDFERVRQSVGRIGQSCSNCHESYRG
jgi:hypothetical protein